MQRVAAILLIVGALIFAGAVFSPPIFNVFSVSDPVQQLDVIEQNLMGWRVANAFLAIGATLVVAGIMVLARHLTSLNDSNQLRWTAYAAAALVILGGLLWLVVQFDRMTRSPEHIISGQPLGGEWVFIVYVLSTLAGMIVLGYAMLRAGYPRWLGWGCILVFGYTLAHAVLTQDWVPLEWYIDTFVLGIALLFAKPRIVTEVAGRGARVAPAPADSDI